jgi:hypothetical protein
VRCDTCTNRKHDRKKKKEKKRRRRQKHEPQLAHQPPNSKQGQGMEVTDTGHSHTSSSQGQEAGSAQRRGKKEKEKVNVLAPWARGRPGGGSTGGQSARGQQEKGILASRLASERAWELPRRNRDQHVFVAGARARAARAARDSPACPCTPTSPGRRAQASARAGGLCMRRTARLTSHPPWFSSVNEVLENLPWSVCRQSAPSGEFERETRVYCAVTTDIIVSSNIDDNQPESKPRHPLLLFGPLLAGAISRRRRGDIQGRSRRALWNWRALWNRRALRWHWRSLRWHWRSLRRMQLRGCQLPTVGCLMSLGCHAIPSSHCRRLLLLRRPGRSRCRKVLSCHDRWLRPVPLGGGQRLPLPDLLLLHAHPLLLGSRLCIGLGNARALGLASRLCEGRGSTTDRG